MQLYIGNKNYSSWSLRAWLLMRHAGIEFEEIALHLDLSDGSPFKQRIAGVSAAGRVPVLVDDDGFAVWDTLAISEYLAEKFPERQLWPQGRQQRARARCLCAEMHSGFGALRSHFPMNIELSMPEIGPEVLEQHADARRDLQRIVEMWSEALHEGGGPFLFGNFSIADAYYAPVCSRIVSYGLPVPPPVRKFIDTVLALPAMQEWTRAALAEHRFLEEDEPYRKVPGR